jgi:gliding motility-associated-like protein
MVDSAGFTKDTRDISGLPAGTYNLNVIDSYLCQKDTFFTLTEPSLISLDTVSITGYNGGYQVSCNSFNDASLDLTMTGGFGGYNYTWSTIDGYVKSTGSLDQDSIPAGNYHLSVLDTLDGISCPANYDFVITQPDTISVSPVLHENNGFEISCYSGADGSIDLNTIGGVPGYQFAWTRNGSNFAAGTDSVYNLKEGDYKVTVKDQNNCLVSWNYILLQPDTLKSMISPTSISCFSTNNGAADLTITGGVQNTYTYMWSNGKTTQDIDSLFTGMYFVDISDANNCTVSDTTIITQPPDITIKLDVPLQYNGKMISCYGASDGIVNSDVNGGVGAYQYFWSPTGTTDTLVSDVPAGLYYLTITDENECSKMDSIRVEQPLKLKTEVYETDPTCFGKPDGQITLIVQGGTPEYSIIWNNIGQSGQSAENIPDGRYDVVIKDLNQCRIDTFGVITQPEKIHLNKEVINPVCPDVFDGYIQYSIDGGIPPYDLQLNNQKVNELVADLGEGTYHLVITDNNQCTLLDTLKLKAISSLCVNVPNAFTPNGDGVNDTWIIDQIEIYPNAKVEIFNRWGELIYFASKGYSKPWDGTYKGRELPIDSYHYVIDLKNGREALIGTITIIR